MRGATLHGAPEIGPNTNGKKKTALVLSAGGMFGSYQAGVWGALSDLIEPDVVIGASVGSLNGFVIAGGASGRELEERWLNLEHAARHTWRIPRSLADGVIDNTLLMDWMRDILAGPAPRSEYGLVTTEMRTMRPRLFKWPDLALEHFAASCAVPLFLRQQRLEGALHADGGLINPLPVWAALEMGATRVVAVNALQHRPALVHAVARAARWYGRFVEPESTATIVTIGPSTPLGTPRDSIYWSAENAQRWIARGREDAGAAAERVKEMLAQPASHM
jgi:NTE family protein